MDGSVFLETDIFIDVIRDFCLYLFIAMALWLLVRVIDHQVRRFSFGRYTRSFYKGLSGIGDSTGFIRYVNRSGAPEGSLRHSPLAGLFMSLLGVFQHYRQTGSRGRYLTGIAQLRDNARDTFSHNNLRALAIQLSSVFFIVLFLLFEIIYGSYALTSSRSMLFYGPALAAVLSYWHYRGREKQGDRAGNEIEKLITIYNKYLPGNG
jgi:hypothetical protein